MSEDENLADYVIDYDILRDTVWGTVHSSDFTEVHTATFSFGDKKDWTCDCKAGVYQSKTPCRHVHGIIQSLTKEELENIILNGIK